ncbi:hypothetical protein YPPY53_1163, partial [Yersinia pestis PY-53]
MNVTTKVDI